MTVQLGQIIENSYDIRDLPHGTSVVRIGTTEVKVRGDKNNNWFTDGSKATDPGAKYVVVGLPEEKKLDLSSREDLALALRQADVVLKAFDLKGAVPTLRVGSRAKVVNTSKSCAADYQVGQYVTVEVEDPSDGTWFVRFDSGSGYWVHGTEVEVVD